MYISFKTKEYANIYINIYIYIFIKGHKALLPTASTRPKSLPLKGPYLTPLEGEVLLN